MSSVLRRFLVRLAALVRRAETDRGIDEELRYHLDRETERLVALGLSPNDARLAARRSFGNPTTHAERAREALRWTWLEQLAQDARYAVRSLRATPVFTAVAALSLAVGVGANVAILSAAKAVLFRRLPVPHPEQLVSTHCSCPYSMYKDFAAFSGPFSAVAGVAILDRTNVALGQHRATGITRVALVTGSYFSLLGVGAAYGRPIGTADDEVLDGHPVAVVSHRLGRAELLGTSITINATKYTIIGIASRGFEGDAVGRPVDVWIPMMMQSEAMPELPELLKRENGFLRIVMRLKPGVTVAQAQAAIQPTYRNHEITRAGANASAEFRRSLEADPLQLVSIEHGYMRERGLAAQSFSILITLVGAVLVIACANVATLFLVRGAARAREMAIRSAVGATGGRLVRQVLTEAVALSLLGGAAGVLLAVWITGLMSTTISLGPVQLDIRAPSSVQSFDFSPGVQTFLLAGVACVAVGIVFGLVPALRAARELTARGLLGRRSALGGAGRRGRTGSLLVIAQIALSIVLLAGTGLFLRSLDRLRTRDLGVDRSHLLLVWTVPAQTGRPSSEYPTYLDRMIARLATVPGVAAVSATNHGLLEGGDVGGESNLLTVDGVAARAGMQVLRSAVGPSFFSTAGMTILEGRDFRASDDTSSTPVGIVSASLARYLFDGRALGRRLGAPRNPIEIVGIVKDTKHGSPRDTRGVWYVTYRQVPALMRSMCVVVRTRGDPSALRRAVTLALHDFDPALPVLRIDTVGEQLDDVLFQERTISTLSTLFAALAGMLACIGLYGMMAYAVARRTSEIGVRMALGTTQAGILGLVLGESMRIAIVGVLVGLPIAFFLAQLVRARLYGVSAADPLTFAGAALLMISVALVAGYVPSRRAAAIDPAIALRAD